MLIGCETIHDGIMYIWNVGHEGCVFMVREPGIGDIATCLHELLCAYGAQGKRAICRWYTMRAIEPNDIRDIVTCLLVECEPKHSQISLYVESRIKLNYVHAVR